MLDSAAVAANVRRIRDRLDAACERAGRAPGSVRLVAASKTVAAEGIRRAVEAGVVEFGENYVQELRAKKHVAPEATWHYIGALQTSNAHHVAAVANVVQTLAPGKAVARLARRLAESAKTIPALIEVDFTGERSGVPVEACDAFADEVAEMPGLRPIGLMTIPPITATAEDARPFFRRLRELRDRVGQAHPSVVELSMGMSNDYEIAAEEGATIVRIGTAVFGERPRG